MSEDNLKVWIVDCYHQSEGESEPYNELLGIYKNRPTKEQLDKLEGLDEEIKTSLLENGKYHDYFFQYDMYEYTVKE